MINQSSSLIPEVVEREGQKYFEQRTLQDAARLIKLSSVSISFSKGTPKTYFICSGIVKEDKSHETKIIFKSRLEGTDVGPISSNCDCYKWSVEGHCQHVAALFLAFHLHLYHESNFDDTKVLSSHPPANINTSFGVNVKEYGTIIAGPHQLQGASHGPTYSSMQYLLHNRKVINFPIPKNWSGKLVIQVTSSEHFNEMTGEIEVLPIFKFKWKNENNEYEREISIFENLYLFNWKRGEAHHLTMDLKTLIQKIRIRAATIKINDLIKLFANLNLEEYCEVLIDGEKLENIPRVSLNCKILLDKTEKKAQIRFRIIFQDENEVAYAPPEFISSFTFNGGKLSNFRRKGDAYNFIESFAHSLEHEHDQYKKHLITTCDKNYWLNLITYTQNNNETVQYNGKTKNLGIYDNRFLLSLIKNLHHSFTDMFFRFSNYEIEDKTLSFHVSANLLFQSLAEFHEKVTPYGVLFFYNRNEIAQWNSRIRFERRSSVTRWFDLDLNVKKSDLDVIQNVDLNNNLAITTEGMILLTSEQKNLLKFMKKYTEFEGQGQELTPGKNGEEDETRFLLPFNRARIFELFELKKMGVEGALTQEENELCERLATLKKIPEYPVPDETKDILRPYQVTGYHWLRFLYENKLGACLADDMGLGKTIQTISFLQSINQEIKRALIVCPVTILLNWKNEFEKFSNLDVYIYHGGERKFPDDVKIILTSYGVMKKEAENTFKDKFFDVLILDEVQHLKNIRSQGAYAARTIDVDFRICLTGTPVENDLAEFYNILDLSVPGIWGDLQFVRTTSTKKSRLLAKKTASPFILRRTKDQVLSDLPPKIENNIVLSMSESEKHHYAHILENIQNRIRITPSKKKYGEILKGLLELRQSCLWQKRGGSANYNIAGIDSTKIDFLLETLEQILEEGHQAIIFSQFTTYLDLIQKVIQEKHWKIARIDGSQSIKKRHQQVELFQSGKSPVFLISLKAGGVGLNLTAASYVFMMDPWWNPAVEQQAIDRAHRIGQKNTLTVYRPIVKGTVEEKVLELQGVKKELFRDLLHDDEEKLFTGKLSMTDFEYLLS